MSARGSHPIAPQRCRPRFRLRSLLLAVAVLGLLFGAAAGFPWVLWRYRVAWALEAARSSGPGSSWWSFNPARSPSSDDFLYLLSDRKRVLEALFQTVETDSDDARRLNAVGGPSPNRGAAPSLILPIAIGRTARQSRAIPRCIDRVGMSTTLGTAFLQR